MRQFGRIPTSHTLQAADVDSNSVSIVQSALAKLWDYKANHGSQRGWSLGLALPEVVINQYIHQLIASGQRQGVLDAADKVWGRKRRGSHLRFGSSEGMRVEREIVQAG